MHDSERLAPPLELAGRKISPKAGIIKSLKIPNSSITAIYRIDSHLFQISIYSNNTNTIGTTSALALRLASTITTIPTINISNNINGSTITGGSRWSASRRAGGREKLQATKWPKQCGRRKQVCGLRSAAEDVNSLARLERMERVGELTDACVRLLTDTVLLVGNGAEGGVVVEPEAVFHG